MKTGAGPHLNARTPQLGSSFRGFGLVELMISVAIGLVILAAMVTLFVNTSRNNREMATANSVIENGRFAIEMLENDVVHAGYWGTHVPDFDDPTFDDVAPTDYPDPDVAPTPPNPCEVFDVDTWVEGANLVDGFLAMPVQMFDGDTAVCASVVTDRVPGTDALVIRHAERCVPGDGTCDADVLTDPDLYIQAALCIDEVEGTPYVFGRNGDETFPLHRRDCTTAAEKRRFRSYIYYVRDYAVDPGDGIPALVRSEFRLEGGSLAHQEPVPLVEGIDGIWVEFGVDSRSITDGIVDNSAVLSWEDPETKQRAENRGDGIPDGDFIRCTQAAPCTVQQLTNVTAVKIYVVARSRELTQGYTDTKIYSAGGIGTVGPFDDGFKRHVYTTTVRLNNVAGRRLRAGAEEVIELPEPEPEPEPEPLPESLP